MSRIRCYSVPPSLQVLHFGAFGPKRTPATQASWPMRQVRVGWLGVIGLLFRLNITNHLASKLATWKIGCSRELHEFHELTRIQCEFVLLLPTRYGPGAHQKSIRR